MSGGGIAARQWVILEALGGSAPSPACNNAGAHKERERNGGRGGVVGGNEVAHKKGGIRSGLGAVDG